MSCHEMRCDSSCTMRQSPHRLPHTTPKPMCEKPSLWMTSNDHFQNKFHLFINQSFLDDTSQLSFYIQNPCTFLWVADFWCLNTGSSNPNTFMAFHHKGLYLTIIGRFFTQGGIYPFLLIPGTYFHSHV